ncbi:MAG: hypothetical protein ACTSQ8_18880 [Candidatus Helarchaeota archaeon]
MKNIYRKIIMVVSGLFVSMPLLSIFGNEPISCSLIMCGFFTLYYWLVDKIIDKVESRMKKNDKEDKDGHGT